MPDYRPYDYSVPLYTMAFCAVVLVALQMYSIFRGEWQAHTAQQKLREAEQRMQRVLRDH